MVQIRWAGAVGYLATVLVPSSLPPTPLSSLCRGRITAAHHLSTRGLLSIIPMSS
jgi:hypothetical protein